MPNVFKIVIAILVVIILTPFAGIIDRVANKSIDKQIAQIENEMKRG